MVGENFEIYPSEMAKNTPNHSPWLKKPLRFTLSEVAKNAPNHPP